MGKMEMKIKLWPDLIDGPLEASVNGDVLTLNGEEFDFSPLEDGFRLPGRAVNNRFFVETEYVERRGKTLYLTLRLPVHFDSPEEYRNPPEPLVIDARSGPVKFPDTSPPETPAIVPPEVTESEVESNGLE